MTTTLKWISSLAVATAISLTSFSSNAAEPAGDDAPTQKVRAWDLDLTKPEDVQTLYRRVQDAASDLCRKEVLDVWKTTRRRPTPSAWEEHCVTAAVDKAVRDVTNPLLAALHMRTGVARN